MDVLKQFKKDSLQVKIFKTRAEMGAKAASEFSQTVKDLLLEKQSIRIIFAAAPSQNEFLAAIANDESIDFSRIHAFHMDEYIGLAKEAPQGFGNFLKDHLFGLRQFQSVEYLNGQTPDSVQECKRYTKLLQQSPIDIVCMGIGENGHIAFNDPHVALFNDPEWVKIVSLDDVCRNQQVNDGCFAKIIDVPTHALTLTIPTLMNAAYHFCMVPGKTKAQAVKNTLEGEIVPMCPASILKSAPHAVLYLDSDSAQLL